MADVDKQGHQIFFCFRLSCQSCLHLLAQYLPPRLILQLPMKLKINKLLPYTEDNKKYKTLPITINNRNYYLSPYALDKNNFVGVIIPLHFVCTMPDQNNDYEYLRCNIRVESNDLKETVAKGENNFKDIKRHQGKREVLFQFVPPYRGSYTLFIEMYYKQKYFIQTSQPPQEMRQSSTIQLYCQDPFELQENIVYDEKPSSICLPLFVQYIVKNKLKEGILDLEMKFTSQHFEHKFLNNEAAIKLVGGQTYYIMIEVTSKPQVNKVDIMFGDNGLMIGTFWLLQGKNKLEKKLFLKPGYKHLLFRAEAIDKNVVKQDIVQLRVKFVNTYGIDYKIGPIRISIAQSDIPPGIKFLKLSKDTIDLSKSKEEQVVLTMICLRSGFFKFKGIVLNIRDKANPKEERILKYVNNINFIVENQKTQKQDTIMERTSQIVIDNLI